MKPERLAELAEPAGGGSREELVEALDGLLVVHRDALERILQIVGAEGTPALLGRLREDPVVAGVLEGHGLLTLDARPRVATALEALKTWLADNAVHAKVLGVDDGVARVELTASLGSGDVGALSTALAARISEAVPDLTRVDVVTAMNLAFVPKPRSWVPLVHRHELAGGRLKPVRAFDADLLVCEIGGKAFAFRDICPEGGEPLGDSLLEGLVLTCRAHGARFELNTGRGATKGGPALTMLPVKLDDVAAHIALDGIEALAAPGRAR